MKSMSFRNGMKTVLLTALFVIGLPTLVKAETVKEIPVFVAGVEKVADSVNIKDSNYLKLRDIAKLLDVGCFYDGFTGQVHLDKEMTYEEGLAYEKELEERFVFDDPDKEFSVRFPKGWTKDTVEIVRDYGGIGREDDVLRSIRFYSKEIGTIHDNVDMGALGNITFYTVDEFAENEKSILEDGAPSLKIGETRLGVAVLHKASDVNYDPASEKEVEIYTRLYEALEEIEIFVK